jgi:hypothetical protein
MSTVEAGRLQGDKVSAIQKWHVVESVTSEQKRHSRLSRIDKDLQAKLAHPFVRVLGGPKRFWLAKRPRFLERWEHHHCPED